MMVCCTGRRVVDVSRCALSICVSSSMHLFRFVSLRHGRWRRVLVKYRPGNDVFQIPVDGGVVPDDLVDGFPAIDNDQQKAEQSFLEDQCLFGLSECLVDVRTVVEQGQGEPGGGPELVVAVAVGDGGVRSCISSACACAVVRVLLFPVSSTDSCGETRDRRC